MNDDEDDDDFDDGGDAADDGDDDDGGDDGGDGGGDGGGDDDDGGGDGGDYSDDATAVSEGVWVRWLRFGLVSTENSNHSTNLTQSNGRFSKRKIKYVWMGLIHTLNTSKSFSSKIHSNWVQ